MSQGTIGRADAGPPPAGKKWLVTVAVMSGTFLAVMDVSVVNVALPHIMGTFSQTLSSITWVATSYSINIPAAAAGHGDGDLRHGGGAGPGHGPGAGRMADRQLRLAVDLLYINLPVSVVGMLLVSVFVEDPPYLLLEHLVRYFPRKPAS